MAKLHSGREKAVTQIARRDAGINVNQAAVNCQDPFGYIPAFETNQTAFAAIL